MSEASFSHIAVVGLGLIGASFCEAARSVWPDLNIVGVDTDAETRRVALEKGIVDRAIAPDDPYFETFIRTACDLVVMATPVDAVEPYFEKLVAWDYAGVITDTASTKARIVSIAANTLAHPENYVPGHPMAGSEVNGIEGARKDMFQGAYWILCPDEQNPGEHYTRLHELICGLGARVIAIPRENHDRAVAVVSHVPHFVASSLVTLANQATDEQKNLMRLAAGGFKDSTRVAAGSPELWCGIAFDNAAELERGLSDMKDILGDFAEALHNRDRAKLTALLDAAAQSRRALPAAWVPSTERLLDVRIPMANRTGVVAEVTTLASSVGCNIQSIEIDHVSEDSAVLSMILTDEGDIGKLSAQLIGAGYAFSFNPIEPKEHIHVI